MPVVAVERVAERSWEDFYYKLKIWEAMADAGADNLVPNGMRVNLTTGGLFKGDCR